MFMCSNNSFRKVKLHTYIFDVLYLVSIKNKNLHDKCRAPFNAVPYYYYYVRSKVKDL